MSEALPTTPAKESTDTLLWLGALVVAGVGISWLVMTRPWSSEPAPAVDAPPAPVTTAAITETVSVPPGESMLNDPLRLARLALEAGMLIEPEEYSAWSLFGKALAGDPENSAALDGLNEISAILVGRGAAALEQGRVGDAQAVVDRIFGTLPRQNDATRLLVEIEAFRERAAEREREAEEAARRALVTAPTVDTTGFVADAGDPTLDASAPVDALVELDESFAAALAGNRLLTPAEDSAKHFVDLMRATSPTDDRTVAALETLVAALLSRATDATNGGDSRAAQTWIDEAAALGINDDAVATARSSLTARLVEMEALKRLPASSLGLVHYEAPSYPTRAAQRNIEGWVDLEFVVAVDGTTQNVVITASSHDTHFRREALEAVERWRFEPREFMGQTIEQRSFTRVRFEISE